MSSSSKSEEYPLSLGDIVMFPEGNKVIVFDFHAGIDDKWGMTGNVSVMYIPKIQTAIPYDVKTVWGYLDVSQFRFTKVSLWGEYRVTGNDEELARRMRKFRSGSPTPSRLRTIVGYFSEESIPDSLHAEEAARRTEGMHEECLTFSEAEFDEAVN